MARTLFVLVVRSRWHSFDSISFHSLFSRRIHYQLFIIASGASVPASPALHRHHLIFAFIFSTFNLIISRFGSVFSGTVLHWSAACDSFRVFSLIWLSSFGSSEIGRAKLCNLHLYSFLCSRCLFFFLCCANFFHSSHCVDLRALSVRSFSSIFI